MEITSLQMDMDSKAKDTLTLRYFLAAIATDVFTRYIIVAKLESLLSICLFDIQTFLKIRDIETVSSM